MQQPVDPQALKAHQLEMTKRLHLMRETQEIQTLMSVVAYRLQVCKDQLVECPLDRVSEIRGEAKAYNRLLRDIVLWQMEIPKKSPVKE